MRKFFGIISATRYTLAEIRTYVTFVWTPSPMLEKIYYIIANTHQVLDFFFLNTNL